MLLLVEANSALFSMPYAMWVDVFSLLQVGVLSGAVVETWIIHAVARTRPHLSDAIDYCCCYIFPYSYFVMLFSMIFYANDQDVLALLFCIGGSGFAVAISVCYVAKVTIKGRKRVQRILEKLRTFNPELSSSIAAMKDAFKEFDTDGSGSIDRVEMLHMIPKIYPHLSIKDIIGMMNEKGWDEDYTAGVTIEELQQCIIEWNAMFVEVEMSEPSGRVTGGGRGTRLFGEMKHVKLVDKSRGRSFTVHTAVQAKKLALESAEKAKGLALESGVAVQKVAADSAVAVKEAAEKAQEVALE
mmetsp:Transcript_11336/g.28284  ORF Transcript_11336/g.28284 Transcript_11336/m.28284 type:complete len:299 (-) Transcript_11336:802-1698(-)